MKRQRIRITGDVQGVFYRHYAKEAAEKMKVSGWIRNEPDGTVLLIVEGEEANVAKFIDWARKGSPMATVDRVDVSDEDYVGDSESFEIR